MHVRQLYVISGVTDRDKTREHAQRVWRMLGEPSVIHYHAHSEHCAVHEHDFVPERTANNAKPAKEN